MPALYLLSDTSGVESKCKIYFPFAHTETPPLYFFFFFTHFSPVQGALWVFTCFTRALKYFTALNESAGWQRHMIPAQGTHIPEKQARARQFGVAVIELWQMLFLGFPTFCWLLSYLSSTAVTFQVASLQPWATPAGIALLFFFFPNFFQCLFLLLAFLSFPIPLLVQFDMTKIKPVATFDMKDKPNHTILPCNKGHTKYLGIKKSSSRSTQVNYFFRETYAIKKRTPTQKHL